MKFGTSSSICNRHTYSKVEKFLGLPTYSQNKLIARRCGHSVWISKDNARLIGFVSLT